MHQPHSLWGWNLSPSLVTGRLIASGVHVLSHLGWVTQASTGSSTGPGVRVGVRVGQTGGWTLLTPCPVGEAVSYLALTLVSPSHSLCLAPILLHSSNHYRNVFMSYFFPACKLSESRGLCVSFGAVC